MHDGTHGGNPVSESTRHSWPDPVWSNKYKTASFQKEAMRTQVALYHFYEVKFV